LVHRKYNTASGVAPSFMAKSSWQNSGPPQVDPPAFLQPERNRGFPRPCRQTLPGSVSIDQQRWLYRSAFAKRRAP